MASSALLAQGGADGWFELIVVVLIGLAALVQAIIRWVAERNRQRAREGRSGTPGEPPAEKPRPLQAIGDQVSREVRKYLGEIGPREETPRKAPPPAPAPAPTPPPAPEPIRLRPPETPRSREEVVPAPPEVRPKSIRVRPRVRRKAGRPHPSPRMPFGSKEDLRRAILAREILGPPVSMRGRRRDPSRLTRR
jgi:hypothetical protein